MIYSLLFKKGFGFNAAIFSMQQVVKYFTDKGSCIYLSALDSKKAFDRINRSKLTDKLCERNLTACVINTIANISGAVIYVQLSGVMVCIGLSSV